MRARDRHQLPRERDGLPDQYTPRVAGYARGPMLDPIEVRESSWAWRNTRTYVVRAADGHDYRAVRVHSALGGKGSTFIGYWAVELLGVPLPLSEWE